MYVIDMCGRRRGYTNKNIACHRTAGVAACQYDDDDDEWALVSITHSTSKPIVCHKGCFCFCFGASAPQQLADHLPIFVLF